MIGEQKFRAARDQTVLGDRFIEVDCVVAIGEAPAQEEDLLARHARFNAAIEPLTKAAYRVLRRLGVGDDEIDDALQSVLIAADRRFDDLSTFGELKAYVCAVAVSVAREAGRRRSRRSARSTPLEDLGGLAESTQAPDADPAALLERKQDLARVQRVLDAMIPERREILVLYEFEELTGREIAEQLGLPAGTVASRLRKAREDFRQALEAAHAEESLLNRDPR